VPVDVVTTIEIERLRAEVASYAADPSTVAEWYQNISSVDWKTPPPVAVGSRAAFVAQFLGRRLAYTYEVRELVPWEDAPGDGTRMSLRNRGVPSGFSRMVRPAMAAAMRRANRKDLARLKAALEMQPRSQTNQM
jgi:hypothetical protein